MRFRSYAMLLPVTMLLASCAGEDPWRGDGGGKGTIVLNLTASGELDNLTAQGRAEQSATVPNFPTVDQFSIRLTPVGGTPIEYKTVAEFEENVEAGVKAGAYTIEAYYGDPLDQGDKPYVYGMQTLRVNEQSVATVDMTATLANSLVEVTYTDAFKSYFKNYSTTLKSDKNSESVVISGVDGATRYVTPGFINVTMAATYINGKEAHLNPKNFSAEAAYLYRVKYDVNAGQVGSPTLSITFDDNIDEVETVEVDLSNDFFSAAEPEITPDGFTSGETLSYRAGAYSGDPLRFNVCAEGKISEVILSVTSSGTETVYAPAFGTSVNLVHADAATQARLSDEGVTAVGLFGNTDKLAMVDVTGLVNRLPEGTHEISLIVKDEMTRVSEAVKFTFVVIPVTLKVVNSPEKPYDREEVELMVNYDGEDLSAVSFKTRDENGVLVSCVVGQPVDKGEGNYLYTFRLPIDRRASQPVAVYYKDKEKAAVDVKVVWAEPQFEFDAFAKWARVKVTGFSNDFFNMIVDNKWFEIVTSDNNHIYPEYDRENKWFVYEGLEPATDYSIFVRDGVYTNKFTTEAATDVPNGDFSNLTEKVTISLNAGGEYKYGLTIMQNKTTISYCEPIGWASINQKTCYSKSNPLNTWFVVPSTLAESGKVTIRSVAYDHNGALPELDNHGGNIRAKYSRNAPSAWANYAAGELFLGTYSYDVTENRVDGSVFNSRPTELTFQCSYTSVNSEKADAYIAILDAAGNVISSGVKEISDCDNQEFSIKLPDYMDFGSKAAKLLVHFRSSTAEKPAAPVPSNFQDVTNTTGLSGQTIPENKYKSLCTGSTLVLTKVTLNYDK